MGWQENHQVALDHFTAYSLHPLQEGCVLGGFDGICLPPSTWDPHPNKPPIPESLEVWEGYGFCLWVSGGPTCLEVFGEIPIG